MAMKNRSDGSIGTHRHQFCLDNGRRWFERSVQESSNAADGDDQPLRSVHLQYRQSRIRIDSLTERRAHRTNDTSSLPYLLHFLTGSFDSDGISPRIHRAEHRRSDIRERRSTFPARIVTSMREHRSLRCCRLIDFQRFAVLHLLQLLMLDEAEVDATCFHQRVVIAFLDHLTFLEYDDLISVPDGGETMRDDQCRST